MTRIRYTPGLVTGFNLTQRCEKCDLPLTNSKVNDIFVAFRPYTRNKLFCVKCSLHKSKSAKKAPVTIEDLDRFLCSIFQSDKN